MSTLRIPTSAPSLIERDVERDALRSAVRGGGGVVVLDAAAGLGKTALLEEGAAMAGAAGWHVRRAAPSVVERGMPFGVLRALLEAPTRAEPSVVAGAATAAGELLLGGVSVSRDSELMTIAHSALWLCSALAGRRPLALVVDDAQWADRWSLGVLAYLARRIEDLPVLLLVATRRADDQLSLAGGVRAAAVLHPAPLSADGAARMLRRMRGDLSGTECRDLHRAARGNPWLLDVLARGDAHDAVRRRLAELSARERSAADALAVVGDAPGPHVVPAVAGIDVGELAGAFDALGFAGLVHEGRFIHPVVRDAVADALPRGARGRLHRSAARALAATDADARAVAAHLLECAPAADDDVTRALVAAAGADGVRLDEAVAYLRRALDEGAPGDDRRARLAALGEAAFDAGLPEAREWLSAAVDAGARTDDVIGRLAAYGVATGDSDAVLDAFLDDPLEHARQVALRAGGPARGSAPKGVAGVAGERASGGAPRRAAGAAGALAWGGGPGRVAGERAPGADSVVLAHSAWVALGRHDAAASRLALAALADARLLAEAPRQRAYELATRVLVVTGHAAADTAIAALRDAATTVRMRAAAANLAAEHALRRGRLAEAEALARTALAFPTPFDEGALALLVHALAERGALADAHAALRSADRDEVECPGEVGAATASGVAPGGHAAMAGGVAPGGHAATAGGVAPGAHAAMASGGRSATNGAGATGSVRRAGLAAARARLAIAEGAFDQALEHVGDGVLAAVALAHLGRRAEAARVADVALARAERLQAPAQVAAAFHARALAEPRTKRRVELCERGLAVDPGGLEAVRLRLELGAALAYLGRRVDAREALRPALADADASGAAALSDRARRELVATGLRPRQAALEGTASLTPRQRQICELAAVGKGNRVIAHELFLSIKTVETHLAAGYRKLGVTTRAELAAEMQQAA